MVEGGDGAELAQGDTALVHYIGINGRTGDEFNNSWGEGADPVPFPLTEGGLITGFLDGLVGQQVGSRVAIAIPPEDGYGPSGGNPDIDVKKDDSLLFVVDIEDTALSQAEGEPQSLPADVPQLETNADDVPTGFTAPDETAPAPKEIRAEVAILGTGEKITEGQTISFKYLAQIYPDGKILDDAYSRGQSAQAVMGSGQPACWDALIGQTLGSRVVLECPPGSVFGPEGSTELGVGGRDTLLFVMDLLTAS